MLSRWSSSRPKRDEAPDLIKNASEVLCGKKERVVLVVSATEGVMELILPLGTLQEVSVPLLPQHTSIVEMREQCTSCQDWEIPLGHWAPSCSLAVCFVAGGD